VTPSSVIIVNFVKICVIFRNLRWGETDNLMIAYFLLLSVISLGNKRKPKMHKVVLETKIASRVHGTVAVMTMEPHKFFVRTLGIIYIFLKLFSSVSSQA